MGDYAKCDCQRCGQPIEFALMMDGQDSPCPHCGRETTLRVPTPQVRKASPAYFPPPIAAPENSVASSTIACSYVLCFLIPIAGFGAGIWLMAKKQSGHGAACICLSIMIGIIWIGLMSAT